MDEVALLPLASITARARQLGGLGQSFSSAAGNSGQADSQPAGDPYEQEADRMAEQVMRSYYTVAEPSSFVILLLFAAAALLAAAWRRSS